MEDQEQADLFPNLCSAQTVFILVLVGELLALVLVLASKGLKSFSWDLLAVISFMVQWIVLSSASLLCALQPWFRRFNAVIGGSLSYVLVLVVTGIFSVLGQWVLQEYGYQLSRSDNRTMYVYSIHSVDWWLLAEHLLIAAILAGVVLRYFYLQQQLINQQKAELNARIQALQSRIRPHFLFNSMNSIASLIETNPQLAETVVEDLSALFRSSLAEPTLVPLESEINLSKRYVHIEKLRLGARLEVNWNLEAVSDEATIPSLLIQPLLENAIYHGIQPNPKGGTIDVSMEQQNEQIIIQIVNPVLEVSKLSSNNQIQEAADYMKPQKTGNQIALKNIRHRLHAHYGEKAKLEANLANGQFETRIQFPVKTD